LPIEPLAAASRAPCMRGAGDASLSQNRTSSECR
jgi:hypothetical protein